MKRALEYKIWSFIRGREEWVKHDLLSHVRSEFSWQLAQVYLRRLRTAGYVTSHPDVWVRSKSAMDASHRLAKNTGIVAPYTRGSQLFDPNVDPSVHLPSQQIWNHLKSSDTVSDDLLGGIRGGRVYVAKLSDADLISSRCVDGRLAWRLTHDLGAIAPEFCSGRMFDFNQL